MDLQTMTTRLREAIGNPSTGDVSDTTLNTLVNDAYQEIGDKYRFFKARKLCTFDTVAGTDAYTLPDTSVELIRVYNTTDKYPLVLMGDQEAQLYRSMSDANNPGPPLYYTHYRNYIRMMPIPDAVYTLEVYYRIVIAELEDPTDTPVIPDPWHPGIVRLARYNYYEFIKQDAPKAIGAMNAFKLWVSDKPCEVDEELMHNRRGVVVPTLSGDDSDRYDFDHSE